MTPLIKSRLEIVSDLCAIPLPPRPRDVPCWISKGRARVVPRREPLLTVAGLRSRCRGHVFTARSARPPFLDKVPDGAFVGDGIRRLALTSSAIMGSSVRHRAGRSQIVPRPEETTPARRQLSPRRP